MKGAECATYADDDQLQLFEDAIDHWSKGPAIMMKTGPQAKEQRIEIHRLQNGLDASSAFIECLEEILDEMEAVKDG